MNKILLAAGQIVNKHKGIRRALVGWSVVLITWVTFRVFAHGLAAITPDAVGAYTVTAGTLGTVLALYHIGRAREDCYRNDDEYEVPPPDDDLHGGHP
jgi:hypothetical protein